jgi:hypothetical protein
VIDRRLVALLWYLPLFIQWQIHRVEEAGGDPIRVSAVVDKVTSRLEEILGVP